MLADLFLQPWYTVSIPIAAQTQRVRHVRGENVDGILQRSTTEHEDIFRYIAAGEPTLASAAATSHVANVKSWLQEQISEHGD